MKYTCPHCQVPLGIFLVGPGRPRVKQGACPACGSKVSIGANGKRGAIVLPLLIVCSWLAWGSVPPVILGLLSGFVLLTTVMQLDKLPPA